MRLADLGEVESRPLTVAELEHLRRERVPAALMAYQAQAAQRAKRAVGGRAGQAELAGDVASSTTRTRHAERPDHCHALLERANEVVARSLTGEGVRRQSHVAVTVLPLRLA